jgi:hypothetical protein
LLALVANEASVTVLDVISLFRSSFYGTKKEGKTGVHKIKSARNVAWMQAKKKNVLDMYLIDVPAPVCHCPSLIQVIYAGSDSKSGARVHQVYRHAQDCIVACRDMIVSRQAPLAIMEVPHTLQGTKKFYIDWDMKQKRLVFLEGTVLERVQQARELALQVPAKVCEFFLKLGYIERDALVQIVIKEGSRPMVDGLEIEKISFHFVFNLLGTSAQIKNISDGFFQHLKEDAGTLSQILANGDVPIHEIDSTNGYGCLVGVDLHAHSNPEQGLAMGFSRKHLRDPYTRFIEILHVRCACMYCNWNGSKLIVNDVTGMQWRYIPKPPAMSSGEEGKCPPNFQWMTYGICLNPFITTGTSLFG